MHVISFPICARDKLLTYKVLARYRVKSRITSHLHHFVISDIAVSTDVDLASYPGPFDLSNGPGYEANVDQA